MKKAGTVDKIEDSAIYNEVLNKLSQLPPAIHEAIVKDKKLTEQKMN